MARVPGREPYRVRLYPHGVPGAPGGPAGAVRRGARFRCSSSGHSLVLLQGVPGPRDGRAGHAEPLGCRHSRRAATRADGPGQRPAPPRPSTGGGMLAQFMAGMTAGWAAGTAPPAAGLGWSATSARGSWRPPGPAAPGASALAASGRGSRPPWLRYTRGHQGLGAVLARPSPVLRLYDQLEPSAGVGDLLREIDRPDRDVLGTGPSRLRRPHRAGSSDCAVAGQGLPGTLFPRS